VSIFFKALIAGLVATAIGGGSEQSQSAGEIGKIEFGQPTTIPNGYYDLCVALPDLCRMRTGQIPTTEDGSVALTSAAMAQLESVNAIVNATIRPAYRDAWTPGEPVGDCKDFAMTKRQRLIDAGWPTSALPTAIVLTPSGQRHLVLVARTSERDFVLDNLTADIVPWSRVSYAWEKIQSPTDGLTWRVLRARSGSATAANSAAQSPS
jgi:predicted transglutaminase-like cysteine proteinase